MKIFKELKKLGYKHYTEHTVEELDDLSLGSEKRVIEQALVLRWFRKKYNYDIHVKGTHFRATYVIGVPIEISMESKDGHPLVLEWNYTIPSGEKIMIYEEAELECLQKLIEIVKNK